MRSGACCTCLYSHTTPRLFGSSVNEWGSFFCSSVKLCPGMVGASVDKCLLCSDCSLARLASEFLKGAVCSLPGNAPITSDKSRKNNTTCPPGTVFGVSLQNETKNRVRLVSKREREREWAVPMFVVALLLCCLAILFLVDRERNNINAPLFPCLVVRANKTPQQNGTVNCLGHLFYHWATPPP